MRGMIITLISVAVLFSGCTNKTMVTPDGKKYTQTWGSDEWQYAGEVKPVDENATKPEESIGYAAGQAVGAAAVAGVFVLTLPLRVVETTINSVQTNKNNSNNDANTSTISSQETTK